MVEIEPALVEWMRDGTIPHGRRLLADSRARVVVADIAQAVTEAGDATYDVVLLDVDNGPDQLVHEANARDLRRAVPAHRRTTGSTRVAHWSCGRPLARPRSLETLRSVFGDVEERDHAVRLQERDDHYWLYAARRT